MADGNCSTQSLQTPQEFIPGNDSAHNNAQSQETRYCVESCGTTGTELNKTQGTKQYRRNGPISATVLVVDEAVARQTVMMRRKYILYIVMVAVDVAFPFSSEEIWNFKLPLDKSARELYTLFESLLFFRRMYSASDDELPKATGTRHRGKERVLNEDQA